MAATQILHDTPAPTSPKQLVETGRKQTIAFHNPFFSQFQLHPHREGQALKGWGGGDFIKSERASQPSASPQRDNSTALCNTCLGVLHSNLEWGNSVYCQTSGKELPFRWPGPFIIFPCATLAVSPPPELTTQQMYQKYFCTQAWMGVWGPEPDRGSIQRPSFENSPGILNPRNSSHHQGKPLPRGGRGQGHCQLCYLGQAWIRHHSKARVSLSVLPWCGNVPDSIFSP